MDITFLNKVVLVTGASSGIGEAIAIEFAKYGAKLALVGRNEKNLQAVAEKCQKQRGVKAFTIIAELADPKACEQIANKTLHHYGQLDVLVNNAGIGVFGTIQDTDMANYDKVFNVNVRAVYDLTRLLVPALIESKGNIVNISSVVATTVNGGHVPYSMSKAAVNHFTKLIALELAPKGVRVNAVAPGATESNFFQNMSGAPPTPNEVSEDTRTFAEKLPLGKICVGADIANAVVHIASDNSRLVTGVIIPVDSGYSVGPFQY